MIRGFIHIICSSNKVSISAGDNDTLTERYQPGPYKCEAPQPADYEVVQPSSVTTTTSNKLLLDTDPQPYEVLERYAKQAPEEEEDTDRVYEMVKNISAQENEQSSNPIVNNDHIYFTLEPSDDVK